MARSRSSKKRPDEREETARRARLLPLSKRRGPGSQEEILDLQRAAGNRAVGQLLENKGGAGEPPAAQAGPEEDAGRRLEPGVRSQMESAFGEDFSGVRVHTDAEAARNAAGLGARAFTVGEHVSFGAGEYQPGTPEGDAIIAHELAHVAQQKGAGDEPLSRSAGESAAHERDADRAAAGAVSSIWLGAKSVGAAFQRAAPRAKSGLRLQRCGDNKSGTPGEPEVLQDFAKKFKGSADLIRQSPEALKLVGEADKAGVEFGGYAEDGPGKALGRPYTSGNKVYVPKAQKDKYIAMSDFLFELNNAIRAPQFKAAHAEARKGSKGTLSAKQYAYRMVELEVEGMLRLGQVWFDTKKKSAEGAKLDKYDQDFFLYEYKQFKEGKKTKDQIVKDVLQRVYDTGTLKGKTTEQYYMEAYQKLSGGK
jgi:hypothetical protein